ncbi:MAG: helix-turn-helix transcriptional regulator [Thermoguttaceae bacterium]
MASKFGALLKRLRLQKGLSLREFCLQNGFDPGNHSRLERGMFPPPQDADRLEKYAEALGLIRGSDAWMELFDVAAAVRGEIPADLMSDAEVVDKLPVLFRTMRAKQISEDQLDELVERIKRS